MLYREVGRIVACMNSEPVYLFFGGLFKELRGERHTEILVELVTRAYLGGVEIIAPPVRLSPYGN